MTQGVEGVTMFEKEAEEIEKEAIKWVKDVFPNDEFKQSGISRALVEFAELGYNKANEWHYSLKGEYPKECENVLCYCKVVDVEFYSIGHTIIGRDNKIRWWSSNRSEELNVYAWKEITPPKELEK